MPIGVETVGKIVHLPGIARFDPRVQIMQPRRGYRRADPGQRKTEAARFSLEVFSEGRSRK